MLVSKSRLMELRILLKRDGWTIVNDDDSDSKHEALFSIDFDNVIRWLLVHPSIPTKFELSFALSDGLGPSSDINDVYRADVCDHQGNYYNPPILLVFHKQGTDAWKSGLVAFADALRHLISLPSGERYDA
jgi:hypothetical protein